MKSARSLAVLWSIGLCVVLVLIVFTVLPARSTVPHLGYGLIVYHYDPIQVSNMNFGWIKFFNDPPQSTQMQSVLLRLDVTATTTITDLLADLDNKLVFAQYVDAWEIGNEVNIDAEYGWGAPPDALAYKDLLCAAYTKIKTADPNAIVVSAGLAPTGRVTGNYHGHPGHDGLKQDERQYLTELFDNGGGACLDVVGYHPYGYSAAYDAAPDVAASDPTQNCVNGFCFRGAEKIYELMQQQGLGDKKMWATELGWITAPPDPCLTNPTWQGRQWQIVPTATQAANLAGAYQYADAYWPWMGAMFVFNLDFNRNPDLPECEQMRYYSIAGLPAETALTDMAKNPASILGKLKTDSSQVSYLIGVGEQPLTFTLDVGLSNWGWAPVTYTASVDTGANVVPVLLNPTGVLTGTAQRTLQMRISSTGRVTGTYAGRVTVNWIAYGVSNPTPRTVNLTLQVVETTSLSVANSSPTPLGQSTTFTASLVGGGPASYQWDYGDGQIGSGAVTTHTYETVGVYTAQVTATMSGRMIVATTPVTITGLSVTNSSPTPLGQSTAFTASLVGGGPASYQWDYGDGQIGSGAVVTHAYEAVGVYTAQVTATNSITTVTATTPVTIVIFRVANSSPTPLGQSTAFTASLVGGGPASYQWDYGDGQIGSGAVTTHTYETVGVYTAQVTATMSGRMIVATTPVTITGLSVANSSPTPLGQSTAFTASLVGGGPASYEWDYGDGQIGSGAVVTHPYEAVGVYTAQVTATNSITTVTATTPVTITVAPIIRYTFLPLISREP